MRILSSIRTKKRTMPNPNNQIDLLDNRMIARLEQANARAYEEFARTNERVLKSDQDSARHPSDLQDHPSAVAKRRSSRARPLFVALIGLLLLAAFAGVTAFAWEPSYGEAAKVVIARWAKLLWMVQSVPGAQTTPRDGVPAAPLISPDVAQQLQRMAHDLANVEQQVEQLKANQEQMIRSDAAVAEQFKTSQEQIVRDNAKAVEQLNAAVAQMARQNAALAKQLKASRAER
jgi:hypothetical protein